MSKYKYEHQNLTLLDKVINSFEQFQAKRSVEIAMLFVCFVLAPSYIIFHIVRFFFGV